MGIKFTNPSPIFIGNVIIVLNANYPESSLKNKLLYLYVIF